MTREVLLNFVVLVLILATLAVALMLGVETGLP